MRMTIGANIKRLRKEKEITQEQLSVFMNVSCAAVSKWERGETYPDITLLQPLAYYFGVTLDELMGYDHEKVQVEIKEVIKEYTEALYTNPNRATEIIKDAYSKYHNDFAVMSYYMWDIAGGAADNDPTVLLKKQNELLLICNKILDNCIDDSLRLGAWNMKAKILHATGQTDKALQIYQKHFSDWYQTVGQKSEQLFAKHSDKNYYWVQKNMSELAEFAADKLGKAVFFDKELSMTQKREKAILYGELLISASETTKEIFFAILAYSFLARMQNDFTYRDGSDSDIVLIMEKYLHSAKTLTRKLEDNHALKEVFLANHTYITNGNLLEGTVDYHLNSKNKRKQELLANSEYIKVLEKYRQNEA